MFKVIMCVLAVIVVLTVGGGIAGYRLLIAPAVSVVTDVTRFAAEYQSHNELVRNTRPYSPSADTELTEEQLRRLLAAQGDIRDALADRLEQLQTKYEELERALAGRQPDLRDIFGAYGDVIDLLLLTKRSQVEALNRHDFSLQEYAWVQQQAYTALGQQVSVASLDRIGAPQPAAYVSDRVLEIVEPHREQLLELHALAWFGL